MPQSPINIRRLKHIPKWQSGILDFEPPLHWPRAVPLGAEVVKRLASSTEPWRPLQQGDHLVRNGDPFENLFFVHSGMLKAYRDDEDGREQVLDFFVPGELVGFSAINAGRYVADYAALTTSICDAIPYPVFIQLCGKIDGLFPRIMRLMSRNLVRQQILAAKNSAEERVAAFLLNLSLRLGHRGNPLLAFRLPMPRRDIANHLRLSGETVSRIFTRLAREDLLLTKGQTVTLLDPVGLAKISRDLDLP